MCGIVGLVLRDNLTAKKIKGVRFRMRMLMRCAQVRGRDAAGIMVVQPNKVEVLKSEGPADDFVMTDEFEKMMERVTKRTVAVIGHTRAATQGSPKYNRNNHPLIDDKIALVHNGIIWNSMSLDAKYGALAEVDSAGLLAAVRHHSDDILSTTSLTAACEEASGPIATVAVDARDPSKVFAFRDTNPLYGRSGASGYWFGSTGQILRRAGVVQHPCISVKAYQSAQLSADGPLYSGPTVTPRQVYGSYTRLSAEESRRYWPGGFDISSTATPSKKNLSDMIPATPVAEQPVPVDAPRTSPMWSYEESQTVWDDEFVPISEEEYADIMAEIESMKDREYLADQQ